jgi:hypothetical protein
LEHDDARRRFAATGGRDERGQLHRRADHHRRTRRDDRRERLYICGWPDVVRRLGARRQAARSRSLFSGRGRSTFELRRFGGADVVVSGPSSLAPISGSRRG